MAAKRRGAGIGARRITTFGIARKEIGVGTLTRTRKRKKSRAKA